MDIGVIGAGLSGLVAAKILSDGGHTVKVYERAQSAGGRLASMKAGRDNDIIVDQREAAFPARGSLFSEFVDELTEKEILRVWEGQIPLYNGQKLKKGHVDGDEDTLYCAPGGIARIGSYLSRWVDVEINERVGGFTCLGTERQIKKPWMLNLTSFNVFEVDAVIVATPAPQAYGLIGNSQDERLVRELIPQLDKIRYESCFSLVTVFDDVPVPDWKAVECVSCEVDQIINESSKRETGGKLALVLQSSFDFYRDYRDRAEKETIRELLQGAAKVTGDWITKPDWTSLHKWKYRRVINPVKKSFLEIDRTDGALALIGDYYNGNTIESAYLSGYKLAQHWLERFSAK